MNPLDEALANLDRVSTGMQSNAGFGGCERCYSAADLAALRGPDVPDEIVLQIFVGWHHRWTDLPALVHRLTPQFLRLLVRGEVHPGLYEEVGELLWAAGWTTWPERDAVYAVLQAWWREMLAYSKLRFLIQASHEVSPWLREFEYSPAALPDVIDRWFYDLASDDVEFGRAEATGWLLTHGVDLLARVPGAGADGAVDRLADLELIVQSQEGRRSDRVA